MKPALITFLAAEGLAIDQITGRFTAFNVVDHIAVASAPTILMRLWTIALYRLGAPMRIEERVLLVTPDDRVALESVTTLDMPHGQPGQVPNTHRSFHAMWNVVLTQFGDYSLALEYRTSVNEAWMRLAQVPVTVVLRPNPAVNTLPMLQPSGATVGDAPAEKQRPRRRPKARKRAPAAK